MDEYICKIATIEEMEQNWNYLSAFRTRKEYQGKGYFSKLYKFMEDDLKSRGYTTLVVRSRTM